LANHSRRLHRREVGCHDLGRQIIAQPIVARLRVGDDRDIGVIALVARAPVGDVAHLDFHGSISTFGSTTCLSINAGQYANTSRTAGLPVVYPVTPGGPDVTSGANSLSNRSTLSLRESCTVTRSTT